MKNRCSILGISILILHALACQFGNQKIPKELVVRKYYSNGNLKTETNYIDSVRQGFYKVYYENGKLRQSCSYFNDTLNGEFEEYFQDGSLKGRGYYWKGNPVGPLLYFENGRLILYNERDYAGSVYYVKKIDENGMTIKEEGKALSSNMFVLPTEDSYKIHDLIEIYCFYSQPDGTENNLIALINNNTTLPILKMPSHISQTQYQFDSAGDFEVKIIAILKNGTKIIKTDSCVKKFHCK